MTVTLKALTDQYKAKMREATQSTRAFGDGVLQSAQRSQGAWTAISIGAGIVGIAMKRMFDEYDRGSDALRVATGKTGAALGKLEDSMGNVAGTVTQGVGDVGIAMGELARRTDQTGQPLEALTKSFLDLERLTGEATSTTIPAITRLFGDWSIATEHQAATMDELFRASQATGIGVGRLGELMVQFGSPLRQLGLDFDFTAAMLSKFEQEGVNLQTIMPGFRMALKTFAIDGREPAAALIETMEAIKNTSSVAEANQLAFETFGVRAGPDMAAAIREGRFEVDDLIQTINGGRDTISAAAEDTLDLSDKLAMLGNRVVVALGPFGEIGAVLGGAVASIGPLLFGLGALQNAFKGSALASSRFGTILKSGAGALGFFSLAAGLVVTGLMMAAEEAAQMRQAIEDLTQSVLNGSQTFEQWRADLEAEVAAQGLLGSSIGDAVAARMDEIEATARSRVEMERRRSELKAGTITEEEYTAAARRHGLTEDQIAANIRAVVAAIERKTDATDVDIDTTVTYTEALEALKEEAEATAVAADLLTAALDALAGTALGVNEAEAAWLDALSAMQVELKHGTKTLDINTQAGRDNQQAIRDGIKAAMDHGAAVAEETGSVQKGAKAVREHIRELMDEAVEAGISKDAIHDYIGELNLTPKQIKTAIQLLGVEQAKTDIFGLNTMLDAFDNAFTAVVNVVTSGGGGGGGSTKHAGGTIGASGPRRLHAGGNLRADEELVIGQRGERMLSAREWHALRSITGTGAAAPHVRRSDSGNGRDIRVLVRADRRRFTDELDHEVTYSGHW